MISSRRGGGGGHGGRREYLVEETLGGEQIKDWDGLLWLSFIGVLTGRR